MSLIYISRTMETCVELEFVLKKFEFITKKKFVHLSEKLNSKNLKIGCTEEIRCHGPCSVAKLGLVGVCRSLMEIIERW